MLGKRIPPGSKAVITIPQAGSNQTQFTSQVSQSPFVLKVPLTGISLGNFEAKIALSGPGGKMLAQVSVPMTRRLAKHNEVKIRWDNVIIVEGKPFSPVMLWSGDPVQAHQLGANVLLCRHSHLANWVIMPGQGATKYARRFGIYFIMTDLWWPDMHNAGQTKAFWANPKTRLGAFANHPNLLGYFVEDEPSTTKDGKPAPFIVSHEKALREMDPYHPTFISEMVNWDRFYAYGLLSEVFGAHSYPSWITYDEKGTAQATQMLRRATRGKRPIWVSVQPFHFRNNRVHPTEKELRHMIYSALVNGATGLGFWGVDLRNGFAG